MRIALDHYKILGVTREASASYLQQTYQSLLGWVPHRDFSQMALAAYRRLLERSFQILSDPEQRTGYDHALTEGEDRLEIEDTDRVGAFIVLYSLGNYQEVIDLGGPLPTEADLTQSDLVLVRSLCHQAKGLEEWQKGNYSEAGEALESAQEELMEAGLFLHLRGELQSYLFKLRPDRILHLLSTASQFPARLDRGVALLKEMISERGGIEGNGNDYSGLTMEQFLHFIQQTRQYLSAATQEQLFSEEAKRPSFVASYLDAYALVAMGFGNFRPDHIRRAKGIFLKLRSRQNVYLESSLCSLLLGQIEESVSEIILSNEYDTIIKLKSNPDESPDLLWSLCCYCQRWLEQEVYPHFAELIDKKPSLTAYFADKQVETYLEELPQMSTEWVPTSLPRPTVPPPTWEIPIEKRPQPKEQKQIMTKPQKRSKFPKLLLIFGLALLGLTGGAGFWFLRRNGNLIPTAEPLVLIQRPLFSSFGQVALLRVPEEMNREQAAQIITRWQSVKSQAMGADHQTEALDTILLDPSLSEWRQRSEQNRAEQSHIVYTTRGVEITTVTPEGTDRAEVVAIISEGREFISQGERVEEFSLADARYEVTYSLVRRNDNWFIQEMTVTGRPS